MAGLDPLVPYIYHERQQPGSMLCAQHALNSLLQGNYFTAPDLAEIARNMDALEQSVDEGRADRQSTNMDDTGFFSIQVLEEALKVWGLRLVRWRSEEMLAFQDRPTTQLGYILNLELHWFTLRRFGPANPNPYEDSGEGHWFNLNSFLETPEWISHTYLGMVLQQAEQEGYSVFAVCQLDPDGELALARTEADTLAGTLPQPTSSSTSRLNTSRMRQAGASGSSSSAHHSVAGAEDEDMMLQAALQASLMGDGAFGEGGELPAWLRDQDFSAFGHAPPAPAPPASAPLEGLVGPSAMDVDEDDAVGSGADPVAASIARNRALMDRMRREQEFAMRGAIDDDIRQHIQRARQLHANLDPNPNPPAAVQTGDEDEDAQLQATLAASRHHIVFDTPPRQNRYTELADADDADDAAEPSIPPPPPPPPVPRPVADQHVVYDDDDAALQAALRASLEGLPEGFMMPPSPKPAPAPSGSRLDPPEPIASQTAPPTQSQSGKRKANDEIEEEELPAPEEVSAEEMRRRRLARFA